MYKIFICLVLFSLITHCKNDNKFTENKITVSQLDNDSIKFKITEINLVDSIYLIYATKESQKFKILSKKRYNDSYCKPIKVNSYYNLEIKSLLNMDSIAKEKIIPSLLVEGIDFEGTYIEIEKTKGIYDLYYCKDLEGLCLKADD